MSQHKFLRLAILGGGFLSVLLFVGVVLGTRQWSRSMYPVPTQMPPEVGSPLSDSLKELEVELAAKAPRVLELLQPGLTDAEISALEEEAGVTLDPEFRELYRWRNGMRSDAGLGLVPGHLFLPLERALREQAENKSPAGLTWAQIAAAKVFAGHRESWIQFLDDGAGDGYFYDPERSPTEGRYFYHFTEVGDYVFFPSVRNVIRLAADGYKTEVFFQKQDGQLGQKIDEAVKLQENYGSRISTTE